MTKECYRKGKNKEGQHKGTNIQKIEAQQGGLEGSPMQYEGGISKERRPRPSSCFQLWQHLPGCSQSGRCEDAQSEATLHTAHLALLVLHLVGRTVYDMLFCFCRLEKTSNINVL